MDTQDILHHAGCLPLVRACDTIKDGSFRLSTPFYYPEMSNVDVFLRQDAGLFQSWTVSDYGTTQTHLLDLNIKLWGTAARREMVNRICKDYAIEWNGGEFCIHISDIKEQLHNAVTRLGLACMRIADICFTSRFRLTGTFRDDVEEFIDVLDRPYESAPTIVGRFGEKVKLDFLVTGRSSLSLIDSVSAMSPITLHNALETSFCKWSDLYNRKNDYSFITLIDSNCVISKQADTQRLQELSTVLFFPADSKPLEEILTA